MKINNIIPWFALFAFQWEFVILTTKNVNVEQKQDNVVHPKTLTRSRSHFNRVLKLLNIPVFINGHDTTEILQQLFNLYLKSVKPLEDAYKYNDMKRHIMNEGEVFSLPLVTLLGPWSTGKSTLLNYILGIENSTFTLSSGSQPTTSDFTILAYDSEPKTVDGNILVMEKRFSSLEKFGNYLLERLKGLWFPNDILKLVNFVDTPGVIENRKQQERGFPFDEICKWLIEQSDLVILVFDPAKLDVGTELEKIFKHLKGHESKVRIVLNKADSVKPEDLLRVYGTLFWGLSPLINVTEPPQVYVSSFWSKPLGVSSRDYEDMFLKDEESLLKDIYRVMSNRLQNRAAYLRRHALLVRNHALMVDSYIAALAQHRSFFQSGKDLADLIAEMPHRYKVYQRVLVHKDINEAEVFSVEDYQKFFALYPIDGFVSLAKHCGFVTSCLLDAIEYAIYEEIPRVVETYESLQSSSCSKTDSCRVGNEEL